MRCRGERHWCADSRKRSAGTRRAAWIVARRPREVLRVDTNFRDKLAVARHDPRHQIAGYDIDWNKVMAA